VKQSLHTATLDNGIVLLGEDLPGLESVAIAFHTPAGAIHDGLGRCGLATLAGEMMLRGAGDRSSRQIVEDLENAGAQWSQAVSTNHSSFSGAMVARQLPVAFPIYADILRRPTLSEEEFEPARQMVLQNLAGTEDDPAHRTMLALRQIHYPSPWGMPSEGLSADVERLALGDVRRFVRKFVQPAGMIIAIAGRIDWESFVRLAERLLGDWEAVEAPSPLAGSRGPRFQHVPHDSQQTHVALAWTAPPYREDDSYEATAALSVLGGGSSSRLFMEVRERRGLCYSVSAGYQTQRDFAAAVCYAGTSAERAQETLDVMIAEIDRLPGSIEEEEIGRVRARARSGLVMQQESSASRAGGLARQWWHLGRIRPLSNELERLGSLSVASVERWLARQPRPEPTIVSLGREPLEMPRDLPA
jgi:predicted Zn-dependent peptidase